MDNRPTQFNISHEQRLKAFDESELEIFEGNFLEKMQKVINWINEKVHRDYWDNNEIEKKFTKRTAREILTEGNTGYMNPCNDLTLATYAILKKNGFKPSLVVVKLQLGNSGFISFHFALNFLDDQDNPFSLDFKTKDQVILEKGEYAYKREGMRALATKVIETNINLDQNMEAILTTENFDCSGFDLGFLLSQLKKGNTREKYLDYVKKELKGDTNLKLTNLLQ